MLNGFGDSKVSPSPMLSSPVSHLSQVPMPRHKDNRWLEVEVCREHLRQMCKRSDEECKFAHPPPHIASNSKTVISCYDSIKGKCARLGCKYYHPTPQIAKQIMENGKINLTLKQTATMMGLLPPQQLLQNPLFYQQQYQSALLYPQYNNNLLYQYGALTQQPTPALLNCYAAVAPPQLTALSAALLPSPTVTQTSPHGYSTQRKRSFGNTAVAAVDTWPHTSLWEAPTTKRQNIGTLQYRELMATGAPVYMTQQYTPSVQQPSQSYQNYAGAFSQPPPGY